MRGAACICGCDNGRATERLPSALKACSSSILVIEGYFQACLFSSLQTITRYYQKRHHRATPFLLPLVRSPPTASSLRRTTTPSHCCVATCGVVLARQPRCRSRSRLGARLAKRHSDLAAASVLVRPTASGPPGPATRTCGRAGDAALLRHSRVRCHPRGAVLPWACANEVPWPGAPRSVTTPSPNPPAPPTHNLPFVAGRCPRR